MYTEKLGSTDKRLHCKEGGETCAIRLDQLLMLSVLSMMNATGILTNPSSPCAFLIVLALNQDQTVCSCWFLLTECCEHGVLRVKPKFTAAHIDDNRVFFYIDRRAG